MKIANDAVNRTQVSDVSGEVAFSFGAVKRVVVKIGSNVLTEAGGLNLKVIRSISRQASQLMEAGVEVILVSSGAMASGIRKIGLSKRPVEIPKRQAVAAVGQAGLILAYEKSFARYDRKVAQILLTSEDLANRKRYLNARNTVSTLLSWQIVPVINENDTVAVESIKFGDNDHLSAMITLLLDADLLINLTDIDGLYDADPRACDDARLLPVVESIGRHIEKMAGDIPGALGTGGMSTKIKAARKVTMAGIPMIIAKGDKPNILKKLFAGESHGTFFAPREQGLSSRKCWIAFNLKPQGALRIDSGAARAVLGGGKSLLPSGVTGVDGEFQEGASVEVITEAGQVIGAGLVNYNAADIRKIMGLKTGKIESALGQKTYDEVIHRDNLAVTCHD
jgi:glutamate 5-kinase